MSSFFKGRNALIATMHGKELIIGPELEKYLGCQWEVPEDFNSDLLGTFTGEIERNDDVKNTARKKSQMANLFFSFDLVIATEGSFGPLPGVFFLPFHEELIYFRDLKNDFEVTEVIYSTETNYAYREVKTLQELLDFAGTAKFPSHGLILRDSRSDAKHTVKGIHSLYELIAQYIYINENYGTVWVETDMRAHHNPSRQNVIHELTLKLIQRLKSNCPNCAIPGYGRVGATTGLTCRSCGMPTQSIKAYELKCVKCEHSSSEFVEHIAKGEDPMYCQFCNP